MDYHPDDYAGGTIKRRKVRKGTHSCAACRRRKVKCVFATPDSTTCDICLRRGTHCFSQADVLDGVDVGDESDAMVLVDNHHAPPRLLSSPFVNTFATPPSTAVSVIGGPWSAKVSTTVADASRNLYTDAIIQQTVPAHSYQAVNNALPTSIAPALAATTEALLRALPCQTDIKILFDRVGIISALYYQSDYKVHAGRTVEAAPLSASTPKSLLQPEAHPTLLARQMLLFAGAVQCISPQEVVSGLSQHQHVTMKALAESAIKLVNLDDALLGSLEGMENVIFEMFYHVDCGNIRRAWITTRRAVTAAQMLGLHRAGHHRFLLISPESDLDPEIMWSTIVSMERLLSLLLGLPTSTGYSTVPFQDITSESGLGRNLSSMVGCLAGKILERNATESADQAIKMTGQIDREIIQAAEQMPAIFWRPLAFTGLGKDSLEALGETRRAFGHMCYYSLVVQLHLPHMLSPHDATQRVYSKIACVNASREILNREIELRTFNPISACCRMSDFMALIAGMALMLGHATSHGGNERDHLLMHQRLGDRATVTRALDCTSPISELHGDVLAVRCATLLRDLLTIEDDAARQHGPLAQRQPNSAKSQHHILIMRVPYLGSICISREGVSALSAANVDQSQHVAEGMTIGGIGSMMLRRRASAELQEEPRTRDVTSTPPIPASANFDSSRHTESGQARHAGPQAAAMQNPSMVRNDMAPPFPAASFDDWTFQGVDTAYMETLLRGSAIPPPNESGAEGWDISTFP
jgi:hypothetical protein